MKESCQHLVTKQRLSTMLCCDHFHPNNIGYQIMSDVTMEKINETKNEWNKD